MSEGSEPQQILDALDRVKLDAVEFSDALEAMGYQAQGASFGTWWDLSQRGSVTYVTDSMRKVTRVIACAFTTREAILERLKSNPPLQPRPDRLGDYYRIMLASRRAGKPPWPGATMLVSNGISESGLKLPTAHLTKVKKRIQELEDRPLVEIVSQVIAFKYGYEARGDYAEKVLEDWLDDEGPYFFWRDLEDIFECSILMEHEHACKSVRDVTDLVVARVVIQTIVDAFNDGEYGDIIDWDMNLDEALMSGPVSKLATLLSGRFRKEIPAKEVAACKTVGGVIDAITRMTQNTPWPVM